MLHPCHSELDYFLPQIQQLRISDIFMLSLMVCFSFSTSKNTYYIIVLYIYILYIIIHHLHPLNSRSNSSGGSSKYRATWGYKRGLHGQWPYRQLEADAKRDFEFALKPGNSGTGDAIATRKQTDLCHVDPCESGLNFRFFGFNMMFVRNYLNEP